MGVDARDTSRFPVFDCDKLTLTKRRTPADKCSSSCGAALSVWTWPMKNIGELLVETLRPSVVDGLRGGSQTNPWMRLAKSVE